MPYRIAGIDVHKKMLAVVVADVEIDGDFHFERQKAGATPTDLRRLADWLVEHQVEEVVMESTAQYWRPVWEALEQHWRPRRRVRDGAPRLAGTLHLAQAQSNRGPGGRKRDFPDAERLVKRLVAQELTLSFVPDVEQRLWRTVMRRKYQITRNRVQLHSRLEALLEEAHIKVSSVVSDLLGTSARRMLQALADGETDPTALALLAAPRLRATPAQLCDAFHASPTLHPVYRRLLKLTLEELRLIEDHLGQLDQQMADLLAAHHDAVQRLAEVPGLGVDSAQQIIAEVGATAATFPSPKHLASWMGACPRQRGECGRELQSPLPQRQSPDAPRPQSGRQRCGEGQGDHLSSRTPPGSIEQPSMIGDFRPWLIEHAAGYTGRVGRCRLRGGRTYRDQGLDSSESPRQSALLSAGRAATMHAVDRPPLEEHNGAARFEFAGLLLDVARRELKRGGTPITLYPRAFDALVLLVSRRSEVLAKTTMLDALWPGLSVEENSVAKVISDLRKALGPAARSIATVQKRGYRLNASVRVLPSGVEGSVDPAKRALAVLPFSSIGGESDKQLAFGLADALIGRLSRLNDIVVRPTSSVARFSETDVTPLMAGRALRVGLVLCGFVRRHGDMTRCSVQLVDVETEASVWAGQFDESAVDIFAMEDAIAARVTPLLVSELARRETELADRGTSDAEAYVLAQRGRYWLAKRHMSESAREAIECFTAAVARDPRFAAAYAGLAHAYLVSTIPSITASLKPPRTVIPLARAAAEEALRLGPDLSEAHGVLAHIAFGYDWDWPAANAMFRQALHLDPRNVFCRQFFGIGLSCAGEFEAAVHQLELARELDPGSMAVRTNIGFVLHCWRRPEQAIAEMEACLALDPMFPYARYRYALALEAHGRLDDALAQFALLKNTSGAEVQALVGTACGLALSGRRTEAQRQIDELLNLSARRYVSAYLFAEIFASLGDVAEAIDWLQKAHEERSLLMPSLRNNPRFDRLRSEPRFRKLELQVGFWSRRDA